MSHFKTVFAALSFCIMGFLNAEHALALVYHGDTVLSQHTNSRHFRNFISKGESCSSMHFTCEEAVALAAPDLFAQNNAPLATPANNGTATGGGGGGAAGGGAGGGTGGGGGGNPFTVDPGNPNGPNTPGGSDDPKSPVIPKVSAVPLPASVWLLLAALAGVGLLSSRRNSQAHLL